MISATVLLFVYSNRYDCANRIEGARRYAEKAGWEIQVIERNNVDRRLDVKGIIDFWKPVGIIAECGGGIPEISRETVGKIPLVYLDEDPRGNKGNGLYVNSDSALIGELAAKELLSLNLPNYAFVGWRRSRFWSEERRAAFASALRLHGCTPLIFGTPPNVTELRRRKMLAEWLKTLPRPCGVFAANDALAEELCAMASSAGISIPDELAVIGVDDDPVICERTRPSLTSIRLDFEQGGYLCAELLDRSIHDPHFAQASFTYGPVLVTRRGSTRRLDQTDRRVAKAVEYIRRNACEGIRTDDVAAEMGVSRRMAEVLFRRQMNRSIHEEIVAVRLDRAKLLLCNPRQDISAIAALCGWSSESVLRKTFKERFGVSMREWREERQQL